MKKQTETSELFQVGDRVKVKVKVEDNNGKTKVEDKEGIVKEPNAPRGLLGITVDGKYSLVEPQHATIIEESLSRMRKLAR